MLLALKKYVSNHTSQFFGQCRNLGHLTYGSYVTCTVTSHCEMNNTFYLFEIRYVESVEMLFFRYVFCRIKLAASQVPTSLFLKPK